MVLIMVVENNITIAFDRVIKKGTIEIESVEKYNKISIPLTGTDFARIPVKDKGRYKVKVMLENQNYSKMVNIR